MARPPFIVEGNGGASPGGSSPGGERPEPREAAGADSAGGGQPQDEVWTVGRLTRSIRARLEGGFAQVAVEGEISNFKAAASGHLYFNLKDATAQVRVVMFRGAAQSIRFAVEDGLQVVLRGKLTVYEQRGEYQIQALSMEPVGAGALQLAFEQLKRRLGEEGLFDPARKRPLPFLPRGVGIVTSPTGAAIRDMLQVLGRRFPSLPVVICPAQVQGERAAGEIAQAIETLNRVAGANRLDVIIVGRGGGSLEDLWAFNEEPVARAIFHSRLPVISAVGHEVDYTIADFVADVRAPTPSAAAEIVAPNREDLRYTVESLRGRLIRRAQERVGAGVERWSQYRARLGSPETLIRQAMQRVDELRGRVEGAMARGLRESAAVQRHARERLMGLRPDRATPLYRREAKGLERRLAPALRRHLARQRERMAEKTELLDSLSPLRVLARGYAGVEDPQGRLVRSVKNLRPGEAIKLRLADGRVRATVEQVEPDGLR